MINLILHDIRSAHNVGSIFRTADGAEVARLFLTGYTPAPVDQFGRVNKEIAKTALGAEKVLAWQKVEAVEEVIRKLKNEGYQIIALEQAEGARDYREIRLGEKAAIILGNEVEGIDPVILKHCDLVAEIPMRGEKESLNVAVAAGIALFRWR
jgi:tRNA G18 (ribose-2'-O)-methylase SpoU